MQPLSISAFTLTSALGNGNTAHQLKSASSGLRPNDFDACDLNTWIGRVEDIEQAKLPKALNDYDCRNNRLAWLALQQDEFAAAVSAKVKKYGSDRVGVMLGTSTSGIYQTELAYREMIQHDKENNNTKKLPNWFNYHTTHHTSSCAQFVCDAFGITGPSAVISTACSSSAKVFANAYRLLAAGLCDAVVVGGVDSLCYTTLYGFNSLQLVSENICRPGDARRDGLSIGEAGGFALVELSQTDTTTNTANADEAEFSVLGIGESGDAYHMSAPEPNGAGAKLAMQRALESANLNAGDIDYINLHGTATPANDAAEDKAITAVFGTDTPASSTKGWTGHTLGAAGILEIGMSLIGLREQWLPHNLNMDQPDPVLSANRIQTPLTSPCRTALSNSFGFGGSNCSVILSHQR